MSAPAVPAPLNLDGVNPRWDRPGLPRKGWSCFDVEDQEEASFTCEMCAYPAVRYVHVMTHPDWPGELRVGCVCAGHLEEDYKAPKERERRLRNAARRVAAVRQRHAKARESWTRRGNWQTSKKGNLWRKAEGRPVTIFPDGAGWRVVIGDRFGTLTHPTPEAAMLAAFDRLFPLRVVEARARSGRTVKFPGDRKRPSRYYEDLVWELEET